MMVVMKKDYSPQELQAVLDHLEEGGLSGHKIIGVERTVIGVVGQIYPELSDELRALILSVRTAFGGGVRVATCPPLPDRESVLSN